MTAHLARFMHRLDECHTLRWEGRVTKLLGQLVESEGPLCSVGEACAILTTDGLSYAGEIVGFRGSTVLSMPLHKPAGIRYGDSIVTWGSRACLRVGEAMLGRVIDAGGAPLDQLGSYPVSEDWPLEGTAP